MRWRLVRCSLDAPVQHSQEIPLNTRPHPSDISRAIGSAIGSAINQHKTWAKPSKAGRRALTTLALIALAPATYATQANSYAQTNLVATSAAYGAAVVDPTLVNAWGIATRPAGLGGHFWITANGTGLSSQWVGDVGGLPLYQDDLRIVTVPGPVLGAGATPGQPIVAPGTPTGVAFYGGNSAFRISQGSITNSSARFLFATDNGVISGWTERRNADGSFDRPFNAKAVIDRSADGVQFFGVGVDQPSARLFAANFGANPGLMVYDGSFNDISARAGFANPFNAGYQPFNVQVLADDRVFVTYAQWDTPGEEKTGAGLGRVAEFAADGTLRRKWGGDAGAGLNAPWGVALAPADFGEFSGHLLVGNFGDGTIAAHNPDTGAFAGLLRNADGTAVAIEGLWGLQFGNGVSLGQTNRLYFAAGPEDEKGGLFGHITAVPEPATWLMMGAGALFIAGRRRRSNAAS
jgi:uncharacterized protein (TIGR03118 family)